MNAPIPTPDSSTRARSWNAAMTVSPGALDLTIPLDRIEGQVPAALRGGRVLSNGPGWTRIGEHTAHPFDGHGYMRAFELQADGTCRLRARFVNTQVYEDEAAAGRMLHRGFATNLQGGALANLRFGTPRNVANTTVVRWGGKLLAGWEAGAPHALDPDSLKTLGEHTFGGAVAGQATLAHMKHDAAAGRLVLCSPAMGRKTTLTFREVDEHDQLVRSHEVSVDGLSFVHDFAITEHDYIVGGNPLRPAFGELFRTLTGRGTMLRSVRADTRRPGVLHLVPRDGAIPMRTVTLPGPAFVIHFGNAFEQDGTIVVDACVFSDLEFGEEFGYQGTQADFDPTLPDRRVPQRLVRITIPPGATEATMEPLAPYGIDFPRFHPDHEGRPTPQLFGATRADTRHSDPFDSIVRVDLLDRERPCDLWTAPSHVFVGEPLFAPDPARDDAGHVLVVLSDGLAETTWLAIFDATALSQGPVARIPMPLLPIAFHGDWQPAG